MAYTATVAGERYRFADLRELLAKANEDKSGDQLAGLAARQRGRAGRGARPPWPTSGSATWWPSRSSTTTSPRWSPPGTTASTSPSSLLADRRRAARDRPGARLPGPLGGRPLARGHARGRRGRRQGDERQGPDRRRRTAAGGDALPQHPRRAGDLRRARAAQLPHRRPGRHHAVHARRPAVRLRRRRDRGQPGPRVGRLHRRGAPGAARAHRPARACRPRSASWRTSPRSWRRSRPARRSTCCSSRWRGRRRPTGASG